MLCFLEKNIFLDPLLVLIEYVPYGDLLGYLRKSRQLEDNYFKDPDIKPQTSLTSQQLMKFSWQVADGMQYLSSKNVSWFQYTNNFAVLVAVDVRDTLFISILINIFMWIKYTWMQMNFYQYFGESFLCGLVTAIIELFVWNDQKRLLHQSLLSRCKQESFIFKRYSLEQTELLFVNRKICKKALQFLRKRFLFNFSRLMIFTQWKILYKFDKIIKF